jgi:hypothetical protein
MRRTIFAFLLCVPVFAAAAAPTPEGRWEGRIQIPGRETLVVVDLARSATGAWEGSIILAGLGIKGAPLSNIVATGTDVAFDLGNLLKVESYGPARFTAHLDADDVLAGELSQAGNVAKLSLRKVGPAQVDMARRSTPVGRGLEDQWLGEFELGGYPRHVTLTLENHANAAATAKFVIVGKQNNDLPVDLVIEEGQFVRIESQSTQVAFEGRLVEESDELRGTIELGPFELPLVLRRSGRRTS